METIRKTTRYSLSLISAALLVLAGWIMAFSPAPDVATSLKGAWQLVSVDGIPLSALDQGQATWVFADSYMSRTAFDIEGKTFIGTRGGYYKYGREGLFTERREFDTWEAGNVGQSYTYEIEFGAEGDLLNITFEDVDTRHEEVWQRIDHGLAPLAGAWEITQRMNGEGEMQEIHRRGTRKTVKLLSGTRFQWIAIDPGQAGFYGTGGGNYTFMDGVYTENIEFFSRDSSRVGMSLSFQGKVEGDDWHHSGKSSRGNPINEVWSR